MSAVDTMSPAWREQIVGHTMRAGELTFSDVAALLEDMASGGYPYKLTDDRVAIRIAIVARAAELLRVGTALQAMVQRYASECGVCNGSGLRTIYNYDGHGSDADDQPCDECADIRAVIAKVQP